MKKIFSRTLYTIACISLAFSCKPKLETPAIDKGSLNLTTYVAIGNSITAGYADNALYRNGQENSYAKLLAEQFQLAGGGAFKIPYVDPNSVGIGSTGGARLALTYVTDACQGTYLTPRPVEASGDVTIFASVYAAQGPFNSFGVPGAKSFHVPFAGYGNSANGVGNYNPFFTRMAADEATSSMLTDALARNPTFFSLFIGNNDVLLYALSGGAQDAITPTGTFDASIDATVNALTAVSPQGVIANVPDITSLPYFTTVPYNGLVLDATQAAGLNALHAGSDASFHEGANGFLIADAAATGGKRNAVAGEFILLSTPQNDLKCTGLGSQTALPTQYVLTATEVAAIQAATIHYNNKLKTVAEAKGLAFVDANAFLKSAIKGITFDGINVSTTFVSGGAFSLDGVHLTHLGNALLTNEFIRSINAKYRSTIPEVDITKYHGVVFP
ncbi:MAG: hypothetical protein K0R51_261 [Cytophagaceae bacterium]|jgi:lysophospholipase L1-like esterase|nr:hypothetical protein [Cytophagaceae bacterium]